MTTYNGPITEAQEVWRVMLSRCYALQCWKDPVHPWTESQTLARIYNDRLPVPANHAPEYLPAELENYLPHVVVFTDPSGGFHADCGAACDNVNGWEWGGILVADFYQAAANPPNDVGFRTLLGQMLKSNNTQKPGLFELSGSIGNLVLLRCQAMGPIVSAPEENPEVGPLHTMRLMCSWQRG